MGCKNVKQYYEIKHIVCMTDKGMCIGSPYIHDIIVIQKDGTITKKYNSNSNDDLKRYQSEMLADKIKLAELINSPDVFENSLPVYTYDGGEVIEKQCGEYGWPNITHDGCLMYDNVFFKDRAGAVKKAKENAVSGVDFYTDKIIQLQAEIKKAEEWLEIEKANLNKLEAL